MPKEPIQLEDTLNSFMAEIQRELVSLRPELVPLFQNCFPNTLRTTVEFLDDGTTFVVTGDIPAMWLRDSAAQMRPYVRLARHSKPLRRLLEGVIRRHAQYILLDAYANAFNKTPNGQGHQSDRTEMSPWIWERKFELDSLCYPVQLCWDYWQATQEESFLDEQVHRMLRRVVEVMQIEQYHDARSSYSFERNDCLLPSDTLPFEGNGTRTNLTGMVWSGFRPSDDACRFGFHVPSNMFATIVLDHIAELARLIYQDIELETHATSLAVQIRFGIDTYAVVDHPTFGAIFAYETDGYGHHNLMDDANIPSLLSAPYLGYCEADDPIYQNTRAFVLSETNPYFYRGHYASGVGSPHTPGRNIWHLGLIMQGLTATSEGEKNEIVDMLLATHAGTYLMHESFNADAPDEYTRSWFAWANSLLSEFIIRWVEGKRNQK